MLLPACPVAVPIWVFIIFYCEFNWINLFFNIGSSYCYNSESSDDGPSFLWWGVPLLLIMFIILPAVWCWRRRNLRASYQPIADFRVRQLQKSNYNKFTN